MSTLQEMLPTIKTRESGPLGLFRKKAREKRELLGMPSKKSEAFQYMSLRKLYNAQFSEREEVVSQYGDIAFHNGCYLPKKHEQIELIPLEEGMKKYGIFLGNALNKAITSEQNPFMLLNLEKHEEGAFLYIPPFTTLETPLTLSQHCETAASFSRLHILVGKGASVKLHIDAPIQHRENFCHISIEGVLEEGARLTIVSEAEGVHKGWYFESVRLTQKRDAKSLYYVASKGGIGSRYDAEVVLAGEGAETTLLGVHDLRGKQEAHTHLLVKHEAPHCISNQKVKNGLFDEARASFEGKIYVEQAAQKTEAYQLNNNLVIGERAKAYSKPNLEIFADDVKASHGSTVGQLHQDELFYLQTRGLSQKNAESLLVHAFFQEIYTMRPFA